MNTNSPVIPDSSIIDTAEELDNLPEGALLRASGRYATIPTWSSGIPVKDANTGHFKDCTIRPVPREWTGRDAVRVFELLLSGSSRNEGFTVTTAELLTTATVIWEPTP